ncbi:MAG: hypothetical protein EON88_20575 [Brevundimonas sp.]|nr:MAG: hypothetical protein EON88_20575 [Brevundimonas sp.]
MRRLMFAVTVSAAVLALGACSSLGQRSTIAQLEDRCDARGGALVAGSSAAEGGVRCHGATLNAANTSADAGRAQAGQQLNSAVSRSLSGH